MIERLVLMPNEWVRVNTEARIVSLLVVSGEVVVYKVGADGIIISTPIARVGAEEIYELGYNIGEFEVKNEGLVDAKIYLFSSYLF